MRLQRQAFIGDRERFQLVVVLSVFDANRILTNVVHTRPTIISGLYRDNLRRAFPIGYQFGVDVAWLVLPNEVAYFVGSEFLFLVMLFFLLRLLPIHFFHYTLHGIRVSGVERADIILNSCFGIN